MADEIRFDWDEANINHLARHKVSREEAEQVIGNDPVELDFEYEGNEPRWLVVGVTNSGRFLVVPFTERTGKIRVVTAWDATKREQAAYLERKGER